VASSPPRFPLFDKSAISLSVVNKTHIIEQDMLACFRINTLGLLHSIQAFFPLICKDTRKEGVDLSSSDAALLI
jgi:hypothetical protein